MFSNISWQAYWTSIVITTLVYYFLVYLLCFRKGFRLSFQKQVINLDRSAKKENQAILSEIENPVLERSLRESEEQVIQACMGELNAFFENQGKTKAVKAEVILALGTLLQKYPSLGKSDYKEPITHVIATQCENICSIHLNAEELKGVVWPVNEGNSKPLQNKGLFTVNYLVRIKM
jgi:hypothetical protein